MIDANTELVLNGDNLEAEAEVMEPELPLTLMEQDLPFFLTVQEYVKEKIKKWIDVQAATTQDPEKAQGMLDLIRFMDQSPSLDRLIRGLDVEPCIIKSFGMAWYDLMEKGEDYAMDCYSTNMYSTEAYKIDGEKWIVQQKLDDADVIVRYEDDPKHTLYRLKKMDEDDLKKFLHPRLRRLSDGKEKYSWKLQLVSGGNNNGGVGD
jgi:hypothetical protein